MVKEAEQKRAAVSTALRRLRAERNLRQADVASAIGVSPQAVSLWEQGKAQPTTDKLWALADYYSVSVAEVMGKVEVTTREIIPSSEEREGADAY